MRTRARRTGCAAIRALRQHRLEARLDRDEVQPRPGEDLGQQAKLIPGADAPRLEAEGRGDEVEIRNREIRADDATRIVLLLLDADRGVAPVLRQDHLERQLSLAAERELVASHQEAAVADETDDRPFRMA